MSTPNRDEYNPEESPYEQIVIIGGYTDPAQGLPEGNGHFRFVPAMGIDTYQFDTFGADDLTATLQWIFGVFDYVPIGRGRWSVEIPDYILGTVTEITAVSDPLACVKNCDMKNGAQTVPPLKTAFGRVRGCSP